jgi:glycerol-3-phosphate dehydrogenase (NAD(P)+)
MPPAHVDENWRNTDIIIPRAHGLATRPGAHDCCIHLTKKVLRSTLAPPLIRDGRRLSQDNTGAGGDGMRVAVIGAGSWGTTLANLLAEKGVETRLWVREQELYAEIRHKRENTWFLPGVIIDSRLEIINDLEQALSGCGAVLLVVPSQFCRAILLQAKPHLPKKPVIVCASKGIELQTLATMSRVVSEALAGINPRYAILSGPTFAKEVVLKLPTAVTLGCADKKLAVEVQRLLSTEHFRVYTNPDYKGVELGGAVKNVIAISAGISDGLGFGSNARAALITRGLSEMSRLGEAMGGNRKTFMGLSGMGDLVLTCTGDMSRNRQVGLKLAKGMTLLEILGQMKMVAEGVKTTEAVHSLGQKLGIDLPITRQVYEVLYQGKDPHRAVLELMTRDLKQE